jgi:hypothetical protein
MGYIFLKILKWIKEFSYLTKIVLGNEKRNKLVLIFVDKCIQISLNLKTVTLSIVVLVISNEKRNLQI